MKIEADSNVIRRMIGEKFADGVISGWSLAYDCSRQSVVCATSKEAARQRMVLLLDLEDVDAPSPEFLGAPLIAQNWLGAKWSWAEIAHMMEDNAAHRDHWLQWQDAEHFAIAGTALARRV